MQWCNENTASQAFSVSEQIGKYLGKEDNQAVGAIFGFIFKDVFGYKNQVCRAELIQLKLQAVLMNLLIIK